MHFMTLAEIAERTSGLIEVDVQGAEVSCAYAGDLLSDVMGHAGDESVFVARSGVIPFGSIYQ